MSEGNSVTVDNMSFTLIIVLTKKYRPTFSFSEQMTHVPSTSFLLRLKQ
jgi:hypothetical protein